MARFDIGNPECRHDYSTVIKRYYDNLSVQGIRCCNIEDLCNNGKRIRMDRNVIDVKRLTKSTRAEISRMVLDHNDMCVVVIKDQNGTERVVSHYDRGDFTYYVFNARMTSSKYADYYLYNVNNGPYAVTNTMDDTYIVHAPGTMVDCNRWQESISDFYLFLS